MKKNAFLLEVASYRDSDPAGCILAFPEEERSPFRGTVDLLCQAEALLNRKGGFPPPKKPPAFFRNDPPLATFLVTVYFRQHASWQGTVCWVERQRKRTFRSVLELLQLMDGALATPRPGPPQKRTGRDSGGNPPANPGKKGTNCLG